MYKKSKVLFSLILVTFVIIFMATVPSMAEECGDVDCSGSEPDISDITRLIDYLYLSHDPLCDPMLADVNNSGGEPDISDIVRIIDFLYLSHSPLNCTVYTIPTTTTIIPEVDTTVIKGYETDGTVTLNETSEYAQNVAVGDVIIGQDDVDAPNGFLRKVVSKTSASGTVVLETEPSTMTEAFEMMSINETNVLRPSDVVSYNLYDGVRYLPNKDDETFSVELGVVLYDQDGNTETTDDQIRLDGQYDFTAALFAEIEISWFTLQKFETGIETEDNTNLTLTANLQWSFDEAVEFDLAEFHLGAIPVGGVVWLVPTLTVEAHIHGDLTVTFVTGISYTQQLRYGFGWANDEFYDISEGSKEFTYTEPQLTVEFNFEPGVSLNASCLLYGVAGPYMAAKTGFHFQAALNADPCDVNLTFDLNAILYAVVGIECDILGLDYNKEWQLYTHLIGEWVYPLGGTGTIIIDPEPNSISAPWSLEGPCSYSTSGTGDETLTELDPGDYTITWESVTGWITPSNSTQTLTAGNTLTFSGTYVANNTIPVLTTAAVSDITQTTAECGGNITSDGGATVTARGVCWSTNPTPTVSDSKTTDGSGTSSFTSSITGLSPSTTYYVRAYATNSIGTGYGSVQSFTTLSSTQVPVLTTAAVSDITQTTAQCGGTVTSDGGATVTARGVCWSTDPIPTVADNTTSDGTGIGSFASSMTGLTAGTAYYVRAYGTNSVGTGYGNIESFTTLPATQIPVLTTAAVSDITQTTAQCGGTVTSDGGATVTARGVCWSTNPTPTVADNKTTDGAGVGSFTSSIIGLTAGTPYYVRAYATNSVGTGYGSVQSFTTLSSTQVPVLTTAAVSDITQTTAQCGGTVTSDGGSPVTARGVCWSTNPTPTVADNKTTDGAGVGSFTSSIIGLTAGTPYYVRAYATNSVGTGYGNEVSFTTSSSPGTVTDIDGNIYQTITIGTQVWMAENLKVTHYSNGDAIPNVTNSETWVGLTTGAYCEYNNDVNNVTTYGRLYNWYAVDDSRSIAPEGWHVPTDEEIKQLEMYLGLSQAEADATGWRGTDEGGKLKETGTTHWVSPNTGATNESGFSALPGGARNYFGHFVSMGYRAFFWSSTEDDDSYYAWVRDLNYDRSGVDRGGGSKQNGFSVRCVRD